MANPTGYGAIMSAFSNPDYRIFITGQGIANIGSWVSRVALGWLTWELTHSGAWLGIVAFADLFPAFVLGPLAGAVTDRVDRVRFMQMAQLASIAQSTALAVLVMTGHIDIFLVVALVVVQGVVVAFNQPMRFALVPSLVEPNDLASAIALNSLTYNGARIIGPAAAGLIIVATGVGPAFLFNAASYAALLIALAMLKYRPARAQAKSPISEIPSEIMSGCRYALGHPGIGPILIVLTVLAVAGYSFADLLPGFADDVFGRGADGLAWLTGMTGLGAVLGSIWVVQRGGIIGLTAIVTTGILTLSAALFAFTATQLFWVALPCLAAAGFAMNVLGVSIQTLIQSAVDPTMRGRVMSLYAMINRGAPALGALGLGALSTYVGLRWAVAVGAAACAVLWLWTQRHERRMAEALEIEPTS